jgi:hypothetical protein
MPFAMSSETVVCECAARPADAAVVELWRQVQGHRRDDRLARGVQRVMVDRNAGRR